MSQVMTQINNKLILSTYQKNILSWLKENRDKHLMIDAVAGSGKSTILKQIAISLHNRGIEPENILIVVFGKQNSLDLRDKFGSHWRDSIHTLHSIGYQILSKNIGKIREVTSNKYLKIAKNLGYIGNRNKPGSLIKDGCIQSETEFLKLYDFMRLSLSDFNIDSVEKIVNYYGLDRIYSMTACLTAIIKIDEIGINQALLKGSIDYTDMLYIPITYKEIAGNEIQFRIKKYNFVLVDECQDLNPLQRKLSSQLVKSDGQSIYVGDPKQSIFGFAGATINSFDEIQKQISATVLPLSACYRCPKKHIQLVNNIYPNIPIKPSSNAVNGIIRQIEIKKIYHQKNDLILCRKTAPLVEYCFKLISQGIPAKIKGKDIGKELIAEINRIDKYARNTIRDRYSFKDFLAHIEAYKEFKQKQWQRLDYPDRLKTLLSDKLDCLKIVFRSLTNDVTLNGYKNAIRRLFSETSHFVALSTIHRAKGLESDRVYLLDYQSMPLTWKDQQPWELEQEHNLIYVALTRSKSKLYLVTNSDREGRANSIIDINYVKKLGDE